MLSKVGLVKQMADLLILSDYIYRDAVSSVNWEENNESKLC